MGDGCLANHLEMISGTYRAHVLTAGHSLECVCVWMEDTCMASTAANINITRIIRHKSKLPSILISSWLSISAGLELLQPLATKGN